ncbi:DUF1364 domain-containing protein [Aliikangiella coralliicola]|uniref:DUF1364 domain-containing protein n=1 Tax=Aliikangiella coralliicola TaxID=2592383 RepID=A0A545U050_9GAMM|nr:DUF1364 domain-containing protein [Aliikangiella coralliicola]TQV82839.1 DUF1364 domain-containing protein [Aliikangiella coralliicola]
MKHKSKKITQSAKGEECQIRIPGVCNFNEETTVFCHLNGAGMALKNNDNEGAYGCSNCHAAMDGQLKTTFSHDELKLMHLEAVMRTQRILLEKELIVLK